MLPYYLPYLDAFPSVIVPPLKQASKSTLVTLILLKAPPTSSTRSRTRTANVTPISNTYTCSRTASIAPRASINKYKKLSAPPPLGPPKPN